MLFDVSNLINHAKHLPFFWVLRSALVLALPILMLILYSTTLGNDESETIYAYETEKLEEKRINLTVALWPHHEPLSSAAALRLSTLAANGLQLRILCASSSCLSMANTLGIPAERLIMPTVCEDTPLQTFVLHHTFFKAVLEREFPSVLQLVAGLCLVYSEPTTVINPNIDFDFLSMLRSEVLPNISSLRFTRRREVVFAQTSDPRSPRIGDLMEKVMASLDPLPSPVEENAPVVGKSRLMKLPEFVESVLDIDGDEIAKEGEESGCIHYDTFQTDCRKGKEEKNCAINAGNEMQVGAYLHLHHFELLRVWRASSICPWYPPGSITPTFEATTPPLLTGPHSPLAMLGGVALTVTSLFPHPRLFVFFLLQCTLTSGTW